LEVENRCDFIDKIIHARENEGDISLLTVMIIESIWFSFVIYFGNLMLERMKINIVKS
jgi:hypothetical protein